MTHLMPPKTTQLSILSHACLLLERGETKVIIDPWLIGGCYWGSWWNFPEPYIDRLLLEKVNYVIISHVHWDHWHGLTLKKFFKGRHYIVPQEYQRRSYDDLKRLNLGPITQIRHGRTLTLPDDIHITCYNFGLFLNDGAIVIRTPECQLLNANDCKITGLPLRHIIKKHGHFDFALRSHSSANYRACIHTDDGYASDDPQHYARSFQLFMQKVKPTYAVPFASNSCHLHQDSYRFNDWITNPLTLQKQLGDHPFTSTELKIMLPGSSWSSATGFHLKPTDCFNDVATQLADYRKRKTTTLHRLYAQEALLKIDQRTVTQHEKHLRTIPRIIRKKTRKHSIAYRLRAGDGTSSYYQLEWLQGCMQPCEESVAYAADILFDWPVQVWRDAVHKKMYHHAFISKRVFFRARHSTQLRVLHSLISSLEQIELGVFPLRRAYFFDMFKQYCLRYREIIVYFSAFYYAKIKKMPLYLVEEEIARNNQ